MRIDYLWSILVVLLTTLLGLPLHDYVNPTNLVMLYLMAIVIIALQWGHGPSILASLLSVIAFDLIFVPPYYAMTVNDAEYLLTFVGLFVISLVISTLMARTRSQATAAREREEQAVTTFELSNDLATAMTVDEICERALLHTKQVVDAAVAIFLATPSGLVLMRATEAYPQSSDTQAVVDWTFAHGKWAGVGTNTLPSARIRAVPLMTAQKAIGVIAIHQPSAHLSLVHRRLLESFANQIALALERTQLAEATNELQLVQEREKFQTVLLGSISHDLRTPLVSITGALSVLQEQKTQLSPSAREALISTAHEQSTRLNQIVGNLLDMSRLEGGALKIHRELCDIQDLVGAALERNATRLASYNIVLDVPDTLPLVPLDFVLMVQVIANLLDNAAKYSPHRTTISIQVRSGTECIELQIADQGRGIPPEELTQIFTKFYRVATSDSVAGIGLGLSICKGLLEIHGGEISAANRPEGGAVFIVKLPLANYSAPKEPLGYE